MGNGSLYNYGSVNDYSIKMQMDAWNTGRGFTWWRQGVAPIASLNSTSGDFQIAGLVTATSFIYSSDRTLKKDIIPLADSLTKILSLSGYSFTWKSTGKKDIWVIAQEVEKIFPDIVHTDPNTGLKSVEYGNLIAPIIEAIKSQQETIEEQNQTIQNLEVRLEKLEAQMQK